MRNPVLLRLRKKTYGWENLISNARYRDQYVGNR